jgi:transcriptional regulator of heat shock response
MLDQRKQSILEYIVRDYIRTAIPVSSGKMSAAGAIEASPATIRNIMTELDEEGYIMQPHTSAGRIPTEKGYQYFIEHCTEWRDPPKNTKRELQKAVARKEESIERAFEEVSKALARHLKLFSGIGVWGHNEHLSTHGLGDVFQEPEFLEHTIALEFAQQVEHIHEDMKKLAMQAHGEHTQLPSVAIGTFGVVSVSYTDPNGTSYVAFSMGPRRMNYEEAGSLLKYTIEDIINNKNHL